MKTVLKILVVCCCFSLIFSWLLVTPSARACTLAGITGSAVKDGAIFLGQTMDNPWWSIRHSVWVIQPETGYKYVGTKASAWGLWTGINEKGFAWVGSAIGANDTPTPSGINRYDLGPMLLSSCVTVYEAIQLIANTPRSADFPTRDVVMGDAEGNLALVEISYTKVNVATLTKNGYVAATNQFTSSVMAPYNSYPPSADSLARLSHAEEWFTNWFSQKPRPPEMSVEDFLSETTGLWSFVYSQFETGNLTEGPGTVGIMEPRRLTYWFSYGWPGGNLPTDANTYRQIGQDMTWGDFIPFYLPEMVSGQYTTELGQLTPLGIQYVVSHFSRKKQKTPAWVNYQSVNPEAPYYKPAEYFSPDGYAPRENPYGPEGYVGTWSGSAGFVPLGPPYPVPTLGNESGTP